MLDHELMFELSHPGRLKALQILSEKPHRLTDMSQSLKLTSAEVSRHLGRLTQANLITKNGEGKYVLTPFGGMILFELSKLRFLTQHSKYFSTHLLSVIPDELQWLNAMSKSNMIKGTLELMSLIEDLTNSAKSYVFLISDQPMRSVRDANIQKAKKHIEFRMIYPRNSEIPTEYLGKRKLPIEVRVLDKVPLSLKLNESRGGLALPDLGGKVDYSFALVGEDPHFLRWLGLLFEHFWENADPVR